MVDLKTNKKASLGSNMLNSFRMPSSGESFLATPLATRTDLNSFEPSPLRSFALAITLAIVGVGFGAQASDDRWIPSEYISSQHLRFVEQSRVQSLTSEVSGFYSVTELSSDLIRRARVSVARWEWVNSQPELPSEPYNRRNHFGNWVRVSDGQGGCFDTRAHILTRTSEVPVTLNPRNNCTVIRGKWLEPFTNKVVTDPQKLQIDHTVPLRDVYYSGGWEWSQQRRCMYFNFIESQDHLVPIDSLENNRKGVKSPKDYMPPNDSYACEYLVQWLKIKAIWDVVMWPDEAEGLFELIQTHRCPSSAFRLDKSELARLRRSIDEGMRGCGSALH